MLQKILKYGTVFVVVLCLAITPVLTASAESNTFTFDFSQPECGETYGYFEILTLKNGVYTPYLFYYTVYCDSFGYIDSFDIQNFEFSLVVYKNSFTLFLHSYVFDESSNLIVDDLDFSFSLIRVSESGNLSFYDSIDSRFRYTVSSETIVGVHSYGNIILSSDLSTNSSFNFIYSGQVDSTLLLSLINSIYINSSVSTETLANIESLLENYIEDTPSYLYDIWELVDNIDTVSSTYLRYLEHIDDSAWDLLTLMEDYVSLQEQLISETPSGSTSLDDSLQGNSSVVPELQGTINELDNITESIKDGKTPEDLKEEVGDVLNPDSSDLEEATGVEPEELDPENITIVNNNVFSVVFQSFGGKWLTYLIMCLTISFAAFILGKRF